MVRIQSRNLHSMCAHAACTRVHSSLCNLVAHLRAHTETSVQIIHGRILTVQACTHNKCNRRVEHVGVVLVVTLLKETMKQLSCMDSMVPMIINGWFH